MFIVAGLSSIILVFGLGAFQVTTQASKPADDIFAVRILPGNDRENVRAETARRLRVEFNVQLLTNEIGNLAGLVIFKMPSGAIRRQFSNRLLKWLAKHRGIVASPVIANADGYSVPTGKIILEFAEGVSPNESRTILGKFRVRIIQEPTSFRPTRFVVENESSANTILLSKKIAALPKVRFAEPDLLEVLPSRIQK